MGLINCLFGFGYIPSSKNNAWLKQAPKNKVHKECKSLGTPGWGETEVVQVSKALTVEEGGGCIKK